MHAHCTYDLKCLLCKKKQLVHELVLLEQLLRCVCVPRSLKKKLKK